MPKRSVFFYQPELIFLSYDATGVKVAAPVLIICGMPWRPHYLPQKMIDMNPRGMLILKYKVGTKSATSQHKVIFIFIVTEATKAIFL
ncbi:MAG: hypothetical protein BA872_09020 [Desulfobacterales bacterium C00003060]|nr:MAG: hypothetical protein BA861_08940 [Desulfobacterales bacterium S3730MH5]OEU80500.1 MAG: hypothetical protein BA872_09020 [Desulfobacterales bacterium C00003060]OEU84641.1 MAG: hypothetical protein BA865_08080 [Desulfobacterales bacterium S5133MH4]